jgi:hypothetical protein
MSLADIQAGRDSVFRLMGMQKEAKIFAPGWLGRFGHGLKRFMIGDPKKFMGEVRAGKVMAPGSSIRSMFTLPSFKKHPIKATAMGGLIYGLPAYEAYNISQDPDPHKAQRIGGMLGGTALGWAAFGPAGMLGSIPAGMAGEWAGGQVGKGVGKLTGEGIPKALPPPSWQVIPREYFQQASRNRPLTDVSRWQQGY